MQSSVHHRGAPSGKGIKAAGNAVALMEQAMDIVRLLTNGSPLLDSNNAQPVPRFGEDEVAKGALLGKGEFSDVHEIVEFRLQEANMPLEGDHDAGDVVEEGGIAKSGGVNQSLEEQLSESSTLERGESTEPSNDKVETVPQEDKDGESLLEDKNNAAAHTSVSTLNGSLRLGPESEEDESKGVISPVSNTDVILGGKISLERDEHETNMDRGFMKDHCFRDRSARYAIKQLKSSLGDEQCSDAVIDMAMEAKFLGVLSHPNIVKMRGTGGIPCNPNFFIVLDRLYDTLEEKVDKWIEEKKAFSGCLGCIGKQEDALESLWMERLVAVYDVARAMKYLHDQKVLFRDLKPENIGFDVRGDAKIFDFGLAKELMPRDKVSTDAYKASGLTGSRRYMSPEVASCKSYGLSADVYSFSILVWEIMALKVPFAGYDCDKHASEVVLGGKRPFLPTSWPAFLRDMLGKAWSSKPKERPSFLRICGLFKGELMMLQSDVISDSLNNRTKHLMDRSITSKHADKEN